jgi:hypothetical protein
VKVRNISIKDGFENQIKREYKIKKYSIRKKNRSVSKTWSPVHLKIRNAYKNVY